MLGCFYTCLRYLTITSIIGSTFVIIIFPCFNVGSYMQIINFRMTFKNKCKKGYWGLFWKLRQQLLENKLIHFQLVCVLYLHILSIVSCRYKNLEEFWCTPKLHEKFKCEYEGENNERRSWGMLFSSQHVGGKKACWSSRIGIRISDKQINYSYVHAQTKQQVG